MLTTLLIQQGCCTLFSREEDKRSDATAGNCTSASSLIGKDLKDHGESFEWPYVQTVF